MDGWARGFLKSEYYLDTSPSQSRADIAWSEPVPNSDRPAYSEAEVSGKESNQHLSLFPTAELTLRTGRDDPYSESSVADSSSELRCAAVSGNGPNQTYPSVHEIHTIVGVE